MLLRPNLAASFGQTKIHLEVRSASPEQYAGDFNTEKEWHQHMPTPWDVMQLNPAEALTISYQSCGVQIAPNEMRTTYGRSFVIKELAKFNQDCSALFPQDSKIVCLPRMASIFEEPGFVTPHAVPSANTAQPGNGKHNWPQLALIPLPLHLKASDPGKRRRTRHSRLFENEAEAWARVARQVSVRESTHGLKVLDRAPEKVCPDRPWPCDMILHLGDHWVFSM